MKKITIIALILLIVLVASPFVYNLLLSCGNNYYEQVANPPLTIQLDRFISGPGIVIWLLLQFVVIGLAVMARTREEKILGKSVATGTIVISIILLLLTIMTLSSLSTARPKARESATKAIMTSLVGIIANLELTDFGPVTNSCKDSTSLFAKANLLEMINEIEEEVEAQVSCSATKEAWAITAKIPEGGGTKWKGALCPAPSFYYYWCVDSTGFSGQVLKDISGPICIP